MVEETVALQDGYVVIHEDDGGAPGAAIGHAPVDAGWYRSFSVFTTLEVPVELERPLTDGETLFAMLHVESGADPTAYDRASIDPPATDSNGVVAPSFVVAIAQKFAGHCHQHVEPGFPGLLC